MKKDTYPLPRIDDLLDQMGKAKYFSTFDLASGFWQIKVHPDSVEKTVFAGSCPLGHVISLSVTEVDAIGVGWAESL